MFGPKMGLRLALNSRLGDASFVKVAAALRFAAALPKGGPV